MAIQEKTNRDVRLDFVRVLLMFFVVAIHSSMEAINPYPLIVMPLSTMLFLSDGGFFMISGYFLLDKELHTLSEYRQYYIKRVISILIPWLLLHPVMDLLFHRSLFSAGPLPYLWIEFWNVMVHDSEAYLWFLYAYIPLCLSAPFWAKLMNHLSKIELAILAGLTLIYLTVGMLITAAGQPFMFHAFIVTGWTVYFLLGHYLRRFYSFLHKWRFLFYALGLAAFIGIAARACVRNAVPSTYIETPFFIFYTFSAMIFLTHDVPVEKVGWLSKVCTFLAKHAFTVYLTHVTILEKAAVLLEGILIRLQITMPLAAKNLVNYLFGAACSVVFAILLDEILLFRIQNLLRKLCKRWISPSS